MLLALLLCNLNFLIRMNLRILAKIKISVFFGTAQHFVLWWNRSISKAFIRMRMFQMARFPYWTFSQMNHLIWIPKNHNCSKIFLLNYTLAKILILHSKAIFLISWTSMTRNRKPTCSSVTTSIFKTKTVCNLVLNCYLPKPKRIAIKALIVFR